MTAIAFTLYVSSFVHYNNIISKKDCAMKKFTLVLLIVLITIGILAACAPLQGVGTDVESYARTLPGWVIIIGAIVIFFIGFGIIWKLIPGFIKVIALIVLAVAIAGVAYGLWNIPIVDEAIDTVDTYMEEQTDSDSAATDEPADTADTETNIGLDFLE